MAAKKQIFNWVVDAGIWLGFLMAFFLNVTGLDFHQWLGVFLGAFALFHLVLHFGWVKSMTVHFFNKTSWRMRLYYLLDAGILGGFIIITFTGVVISSWLSLDLTHYSAWRDVHVDSSVITLLAVVIKLGLHWRWIMSTLAKILTPPTAVPQLVPAPVLQPVRNGRKVSRREFLVMMGVVGAGAALGIGNVLGEKKGVEARAIGQIASTDRSAFVTDTSSSNAASSTSPAAAVPTAAAATGAGSSSAALICTQRCPKGKHCSFPGSCRRYNDSNNNGRCDLGECA
jgi:hypothetical protein